MILTGLFNEICKVIDLVVYNKYIYEIGLNLRHNTKSPHLQNEESWGRLRPM